AVGVWENYILVNNKVDEEAATLSAVYRDVNSYPEPYRSKLTGELKAYTRYVIDEAWPLQEKGIAPSGGVHDMNIFQQTLYAFEPVTEGQKIIHEAHRRKEQYPSPVMARPHQLHSVYMLSVPR